MNVKVHIYFFFRQLSWVRFVVSWKSAEKFRLHHWKMMMMMMMMQKVRGLSKIPVARDQVGHYAGLKLVKTRRSTIQRKFY
jgi:microcompartment protein CcmK/EutM